MPVTYAHRYGDFAEARMSPEEIAAIQDVPLLSEMPTSRIDDIVDAMHEDPNVEGEPVIDDPDGVVEFMLGEDDEPVEIEDLSEEELDALTS